MISEKHLKLMITLTVFFLVAWIYPSSFTKKELVNPKPLINNNIPINFNIKKETVGTYKYQIKAGYEVKRELIGIKEYQVQIGLKKVRTGEFNRVKYLGRYVYQNKISNVSNKEINYVLNYQNNDITYYVYDIYELEEVVIDEIIYETREENIYEETFYPIYKEKEKVLYSYNIEVEGSNISIFNDYNYLEKKFDYSNYLQVVFLEPYKRYKVIFI